MLQGAVEPMQIDVDPQEDPQNAPDVNYVVENPTLVWSLAGSPRGWVRGWLECQSCGKSRLGSLTTSSNSETFRLPLLLFGCSVVSDFATKWTKTSSCPFLMGCWLPPDPAAASPPHGEAPCARPPEGQVSL